MGQFEASVVLPRPRVEAFDFLRVPSNLMKLLPQSATQHVDARLPELLDLGSCMEFNFKAMGNHFQIVHEITDLRTGERIVATQQKGPFRHWVHEQRFEDAPDGGTLLTNIIRFEPPGGLLGFIVTRKQVLSHLEQWVGEGHELIRKSMASDRVAT